VRIRTRAASLCAALAGAGLLAAPSHAAFPGGDGRLAFDSDRTGDFEIYTMAQDGSALRNLTSSPATADVNPVWDPGGDLIVHASGPPGGPFDMRVMNADGSGGTPLAPHPANDIQPTFCDPDTVVFPSDRDGDVDLWEVRLDGTGLRQMANLPGNQVQPTCRPNGQRIACASNQDGNFEVYEIGRDGSDPVNLTNHPAFDLWPDYHPDGTSLLIASTRDGNSDIYRLDLAPARGSGLPAIEQLTDSNAPVQ
jgi:Tol biopolymer transport system component